jgi:phosphoribosylanthranilate isomerase
MRTRIKVCGLTRESDVDAAVAAGVDAVGFVFYAASPRAVSASQARALVRRLPAWVSAVGLFVNAPRDTILRVANEAGLSHIQLHGDESPADCQGLGRPVIKAIRVKTGLTPAASGAEADRVAQLVQDFSDCQAVLFDADSAGFGGSGQAFDWSILSRAFAKAPALRATWVLSGGLESGSVGQAIAAIAPPCVDVSSGVEVIQGGSTVKGVKDAQRIAQFVAAVNAVDQAAS